MSVMSKLSKLSPAEKYDLGVLRKALAEYLQHPCAEMLHDKESRISVLAVPADPDIKNPQIFKVATSLCHPKDKFRKKRAEYQMLLDLDLGAYILVRRENLDATMHDMCGYYL